MIAIEGMRAMARTRDWIVPDPRSRFGVRMDVVSSTFPGSSARSGATRHHRIAESDDNELADARAGHAATSGNNPDNSRQGIRRCPEVTCGSFVVMRWTGVRGFL
nr:hypothetical protein GCM10017745_68490 [Saccharothrix mutabilis subsp. capreolus]